MRRHIRRIKRQMTRRRRYAVSDYVQRWSMPIQWQFYNEQPEWEECYARLAHGITAPEAPK